MTNESCPHPDDLQKFVRCSVPEERADSIAEHLEDCPTCEETVVGLERDGDTVADHIRKAVMEPTFAHEPECEQILQSMLERTAHRSGSTPATETELPRDKNLRDYQIIAKIGEGGMGAVYKAVHQRLKKAVALKVLPTNRIGDQAALARFEREMSVLGQLNHPNIVQALDAGEHEGQHYLVMEYVEGCELSDIIKCCSPLSIANACELISQAAVGLQYAHEHGFVHRDIKPSNLMLATTGQRAGHSRVIVKILDLGLARALDQPTGTAPAMADLTTTGQVMGTLDYMAPEQGDDVHQVDIRADIYSLGATLYKLLTGDSPYAEHAQKPPLQRLMAIAQHQPPAIQSKRADIPNKLASIVHRMLAKKPENRFATPAEVTEALRPFCVGADLAALFVQHGATRTLGSRSQVTPLAKQSASGRGVNRRWKTAVAGLAGFFVLAAIVLVTTRHGTVEVTSSDGKLPHDVKVVVSRGGEEVELLQADNQWSAKIVNGEYQLQLRGGENRFELKDSKLIVHRMGQATIMVDVRKPAVNAALTSTPANPSTPSVLPAATPPESPTRQTAKASTTPYTIVRDGKDLRSFRSLPGAIADHKPGDVIEVRSNERLLVASHENITKSLSIRAGKGFRPLLAFEKPVSGFVGIQADWDIEGCDLDLRVISFWGDGTTARTWDLRSCRIWGALPSVAKLTCTDCIAVFISGYAANGVSSAELVFDNCVLRNRHYFIQADAGDHTLRLRNCTYYDVDQRAPSLVRLGEKATLTVEATGNVFHRQSQMPLLIEQKSLPRVTWTGSENCYSGDFYGVYEHQSDNSWVVKEKGLSGWNKLWKTPEHGSRENGLLAFEWGRIQRISGRQRLPQIQESIELLNGAETIPGVGPNWSLVGPGDAYVRALAAEGRPVNEADLRPEQLSGGPVTLIRKDQESLGYPTLSAALDAAQDHDALEIRTDGPLPITHWTGKARKLTIRAAAGYTPLIEGLVSDGSDRLILEGLAIQSKISAGNAHLPGWMNPSPEAGNQGGAVLKVMNCEILDAEGGFAAPMNGDGNEATEVVNSSFPIAAIGLDSARVVRLHNSVFGYLYCGTGKASAPPSTVEIVGCAFWLPEPAFIFRQANLLPLPATRFAVQRSIFVSPMCVISGDHAAWEGSSNLYVNAYEMIFGHGITGLAYFQAENKTEADSLELPPWEFDPAQWRILRDKSPEYGPRPDGTDYGVDIDRMIKAMGSISSP